MKEGRVHKIFTRVQIFLEMLCKKKKSHYSRQESLFIHTPYT